MKRLLVSTAFFLSLVSALLFVDASAYEKPAINDITLIDQFAETFTLDSIQGKAALVLFGYTSCPDVCPMGLTIVSNILRELGQDANKLTTIFISVDPVRDTPTVLRPYLSWFHQDIIGLTGTKRQINAVTQAFNVQYSLNRVSEQDTEYVVDHSSGFYLLNKQTRLTQIIPFGLPTEHTLQAVKHLISTTEAGSAK